MTRTLILIRHGIAEPVVSGGSDAERGLSAVGRRRFREVVKGLGKLGIELHELVHSPLRRPVETADLHARLLAGGSRV